VTSDDARYGSAAALAARERLGVGVDGPLPDILVAVEGTGQIPVAILPLADDVAGAYGRKQEHPFIFVNSAHCTVRQRFTLAHEFAHHELRHRGSFDRVADLAAGAGSPAEVQANYFAAEFLAPKNAVANWVEARDDDPAVLTTVVTLSHAFRVSASVALYRLARCRFLGPAAVRRLEDAISRGEHTTLERRLALRESPDTMSQIVSYPRIPQMMLLNAAAVYENGLLSLVRLAELTGRSARDLETEFTQMGLLPPNEEPDY
jgi:Zn-dependent peptidase ImmA (M78 family)